MRAHTGAGHPFGPTKIKNGQREVRGLIACRNCNEIYGDGNDGSHGLVIKEKESREDSCEAIESESLCMETFSQIYDGVKEFEQQRGEQRAIKDKLQEISEDSSGNSMSDSSSDDEEEEDGINKGDTILIHDSLQKREDDRQISQSIEEGTTTEYKNNEKGVKAEDNVGIFFIRRNEDLVTSDEKEMGVHAIHKELAENGNPELNCNDWGQSNVEQDLLHEEGEGDDLKVGQPFVKISVYGREEKALLDTGSEISAIEEGLFNDIRKHKEIMKVPVLGLKIVGATGKLSKIVKHQIMLEFEINGIRLVHNFFVIPDLTVSIILGMDWLTECKAEINCGDSVVSFENEGLKGCVNFDGLIVGNGHLVGHLKVKCMTIRTGYDELQLNLGYKNEGDGSGIMEELKEQMNKVEGLEDWQKEELREVLWVNREVFSNRPGKVKNFECKLDIKPHEPFSKKPYSIPFGLREEVYKEIDRMVECGVLERSNSEYNSPLIVVKKKDGSVRVVIDARMLNTIVRRENDRPESMDRILQKHYKMNYITSLDLTSGYWQVPLAREYRKYTAFLVNGKCYQYTVVPFGLNISVSVFIRALDQVLGPGLSSKLTIYVDDLLISTESWKEHCDLLNEVFQALRKGGMTLRLKKCEFVRKEIKFLGRILSTTGIRIDPDKIRAIKECQPPKNRKQLKSILGLCNFYRNFVSGQAFNNPCLNKLLSPKINFVWTKECQEAFEELKSVLKEDRILHHPDLKRPFGLGTDSSGYGIGVELFQNFGDEENEDHRTIAFASRALTKYEKNYSVTEQEALAIVWGFQKFRDFLWGNKTTIYTDHRALIFLKKFKLMHGRLTRWVLFLQQFEFEIRYVPGPQNKVADALSRLPVKEESEVEVSGEEEQVRVFYMKGVQGEKKIENICKSMRRYQNHDEIWRMIKSDLCKPDINSKLLKYYRIFDGVLFRRSHENSEDWKVCWPKEYIDDIIDYIHLSFGHVGTKKCVQKLRESVTFDGMIKSVDNRIKTCDKCQRAKVTNQTCRLPMQHVKPDDVMELLSVDFYGPLPRTKGGYAYIFVVLEVFSKFIRLYPLKKATGKAILTKLEKDYFVKFGKPKAILSDNGSQFTCKTWKEGLTDQGVKVIYTSTYHPSGNPVERYMREIGRYCRTYCSNNHSSWGDIIEDIEDIMNNVAHDVTGFTPTEIMKGERSLSLVEERLSFPPRVEPNWGEKKKRVRELVEKKLSERKKRHDERIKSKDLKVGDLVLVKAYERSKEINNEISKFFDVYKGPFEVASIPHPNAYYLIYPKSKKKFALKNIVDLKPYKRRK